MRPFSLYHLIFYSILLFTQCSSPKTEEITTTLPLKNEQTLIDSTPSTTPTDTAWLSLSEDEIDASTPTQLIPSFSTNSKAQPLQWKTISKGLDVAIIDAPIKSSIGDSKIRIVRVNPEQYDFKLLTVKQLNTPDMRTAKGFCKDFNLLGAINTSMFGYDLRSVGYMKSEHHINNSTLNSDKCMIAFNPKDNTVPKFKIIDLGCENWEDWKDKYHSYIQNIRIIDCQQRIKWSKQEKFWSTACIGEDAQGNALFIHCRSPYRVHDLAKMLLQLPLQLKKACYLEGGPESTLYLQAKGYELSSFGSYETGFNEDDENTTMWQIPNVIGFVER